MSAPAPRPALRKAPDAHVHPAAPTHSARQLRHAEDASGTDQAAAAPADAPAATAETTGTPAPSGKPGRGRLSGPPGGTTSDMLRSAGKAGRRATRGRTEKSVELTVSVPKSLRKDFRDRVKATRADPNEIVASLLHAWLHG